jgi:hypothetical protein
LVRCRHHHTTSLVRVVPGTITFSENIVCVIADERGHLSEERFFLRSRDATSSKRQPLGIAKPDVHAARSAALGFCSSPLEPVALNATSSSDRCR